MRLELERLLPPLPPFDEERDFARVRLRPLPDEPLPFDEPLLRLDAERLPELDPDDFDLLEAELRLRELEDERCFFTSPSSIRPRHSPSASSFIIT